MPSILFGLGWVYGKYCDEVQNSGCERVVARSHPESGISEGESPKSQGFA